MLGPFYKYIGEKERKMLRWNLEKGKRELY